MIDNLEFKNKNEKAKLEKKNKEKKQKIRLILFFKLLKEIKSTNRLYM